MYAVTITAIKIPQMIHVVPEGLPPIPVSVAVVSLAAFSDRLMVMVTTVRVMKIRNEISRK